MDSDRAVSKLTRTTAASANMTRQVQSKKSNFGRSAAGMVTKPRSMMNDQGKHMKTAGEVLSYPYTFEEGGNDGETVNLSN